MSPLEAELRRQRAQLAAIETTTAEQIARAYRPVLHRLNGNLSALTQQIDDARARGIEVRPGWLAAQDRYRRLVDDMDTEMIRFLTATHGHVTSHQRATVAEAITHGRRLAPLALGPAPRRAVAAIEGRFNRLPVEALRRLVGNAADGRPLGLLLAEIAPATVQGVREALFFGVAAGRSPRLIAEEVRVQSGVSLNRALTISRTESLRAYREATAETHRATGIVTSWVWHAEIGPRTCAMCVAMHGTEHPMDEDFESHPSCRCSRVPRTPSWAELGFDGIPDNRPRIEPGAAVFDRLPDGDKLAILGRGKLDAINRGEITLADLVRRTESPRWGAGRRQATLREAMAA